MLLLFTLLLFIMLFSRIIEKSFSLPSTLTIIVLSFLVHLYFPNLIEISKSEFDEILYLMIPIILLPDVLSLSINDLKRDTKEILYLAFFSVILSISLCTLLSYYFFIDYGLSIGAIIALFTMLMATDAITVNSIMSKFKLPHKLKTYAESESLFNDATALILFYFFALPLLREGSFSFIDLNLTLIKVFLLSIFIGAFTSLLGYFCIKIFKEPFEQFVIIYLIVSLSFLISEHFHIAGILAIVSSVLTLKYLIQKDLSLTNKNLLKYSYHDTIIALIKKVPALSKKEFREYKKESIYIGLFANTIIFTILANIIEFELLVKYLKEIVVVFLITTFVRTIFITLLIKYKSLPKRWIYSLSFAGTKGALAIVMVHSLPLDFKEIELFESIVIGNVLLSTFIYTIVLMVHIKKEQKGYERDILEEDNIIDSKRKDSLSKAYTKNYIDTILLSKIERTIKYEEEFSIISLEIEHLKERDKEYEKVIKTLSKAIKESIREGDYFAKLSVNRYLLLLGTTSLAGAFILTQKLDKKLSNISHISKKYQIHFGITKIEQDDEVELIYEKIEDSLNESKQKNHGKIEIEV